nr:hypothetical protein [Mycobacterium eburneum]
MAAVVEILVAVGVVWLLTHTAGGESVDHHHHHGDMHGMPPAGGDVTAVRGTWPTLVAGVIAVAAAMWWLRRRSVLAGIVTAAGLFAVVSAAPVRVLAAGSHVVLMVVVETATTAIPLAAVLSWRHRPTGQVAASRWPYVWVSVGTFAYATLLVALHLPVVHHSILAGTTVPWWAVALAAAVGTAYWVAILRVPAPLAVRRSALVIGQEVAAMIGLITVLGGGAVVAASAPATSGMRSDWDHRLGGVVMLAACVAVSVPMLRRLRPATGAESSAPERHP